MKYKQPETLRRGMLDIVQSFPLLFYCIVSPIYISPICNVYIEINYSGEIRN